MSRDSDFAATLEEWRKIEEEMQAGHGLRDNGKPFTLASDARHPPGCRRTWLAGAGITSTWTILG